MLYTAGRQFVDWSADYRLFERARFDPERLFAPARRAVVAALADGQQVVAHIDDTRSRRSGKKVAGVSWHRDPLGPHFRTQFLWGHRFLQISLSLPEGSTPRAARAIPVDLQHCPCARKPRRNDPPEVWQKWKAQRRQQRLPAVAARRLARLRADLDADPGGRERLLVTSVDGGFTNTALFRSIPPHTTLIGRVRKDATLHAPPEPAPARGRGRRRVYGAALPTPQAVLQDALRPWQEVQAWAAGRLHAFRIKTLSPVRWRGAGAHDLRLVVIAPLGYRLSKHSRVLYREPAFLLCTDPDLSLEKIIQSYLWRWGIEVNFRDEKTLIGLGEAQVWNEKAVALVPAFLAAAYAFLQLAGHGAFGDGPCPLPNPRWQRRRPQQRITTGQMIKLLRGEIWGQALGVWNFSDFADETLRDLKSEKNETHLKSAVIYAIR